MDGWNYILDGTSYISDQMKRAILHEIYHIYAAIDLYDNDTYPDIETVIMDGAENWDSQCDSVRIHPITYDWITKSFIKFDGVRDG